MTVSPNQIIIIIIIIIKVSLKDWTRFQFVVLLQKIIVFSFAPPELHNKYCPSLWLSGTSCEFDSWQCRIYTYYIPCSMESCDYSGPFGVCLGTYGLIQEMC